MSSSMTTAALCLDSKCSFGKIKGDLVWQWWQLCLDSKCSFGKIKISV